MTAETVVDILPSDRQSAAFDAIAEDYDRIFTHSLLGKTHRSLIHECLRMHLRPGQRVLDLNCGTGEDAIYLSSLGISVVACDISERMIGIARQKSARQDCPSELQFSVCANENLDRLSHCGPFDAVLSNFGGLNCTTDLGPVARELSRLVRPGGRVFVCMIGRTCAWEILWYTSGGNWRKAFRRLRPGGTRASIGGASVHVSYPSVRESIRAFAPSFRLESWSGIGVVLPPSWLAVRFEDRPKAIERLKGIDRWFGGSPIFRGFADHILFQFVREQK